MVFTAGCYNQTPTLRNIYEMDNTYTIWIGDSPIIDKYCFWSYCNIAMVGCNVNVHCANDVTFPNIYRKKRRGRRKSNWLKNGIWFQAFGTSPTAPCYWCRKLFTFKEMTIDHEPCRSKGGKWRDVVLACYECNQNRARQGK